MAKRPTDISFADCLGDYFEIVKVTSLGGKLKRVDCILETEDFTANLVIGYQSNVRLKPPVVICMETWIIRETNWHCSSEGGLCWIKEQLWRKLHGSSEKTTALVYEEGARQLHNDVLSLINKHYYAKMTGITEWQKEWDEWSHFEKGNLEYKAEVMNQFGLPQNCKIIGNDSTE